MAHSRFVSPCPQSGGCATTPPLFPLTFIPLHFLLTGLAPKAHLVATGLAVNSTTFCDYACLTLQPPVMLGFAIRLPIPQYKINPQSYSEQQQDFSNRAYSGRVLFQKKKLRKGLLEKPPHQRQKSFCTQSHQTLAHYDTHWAFSCL